MNNFKFRITLQDNLNPINTSNFLKSLGGEYFIVLETGKEGDNPHIQSYIKTHLQQQAIRKRFLTWKKTLTMAKGNELYSLKDCMEDYPIEYLGYLMKEDKNPDTNISEEQLEESREYYKLFQEERKKRKEEKKPAITILKELVAIAFEEATQEQRDKVDFREKIIFNTIINYHTENNKLIRVFLIQSYYDTIALEYIHYFEDELFENITGKYKKLKI